MGAAGAGAVAAVGSVVSMPAGASDKKDKKWGVVVVGAGTAGFVCAITAHDAGAKVCVIEKADRPDGNSIYPEFADLFYAYGVLDSGRFIGESSYLVWLRSNQASFYLRA